MHRFILLFLCAVCVAGCIHHRQKHAPIETYALELPYSLGTPKAGLVIDRFGISSLYRGKEFIYKHSQGNIEHDFYHQFITFPEDMFTELTAQWFQAPSRIHRGYRETHDTPRLILSGFIDELYSDLSHKEGAHAVLRITCTVYSAKGLKRIELLKKTYSAHLPLTHTSITAIRDGWSKAFTSILEEISTDIAPLQP